MEDNHLINPEKLATLLSIFALTVVWAYRFESKVLGRKSIRKKSHKRLEKSWFRNGRLQ